MLVISNFEEAKDANFYYLSGIEEPCEGILLYEDGPVILTTPLSAKIAEKYCEDVVVFERFSELLQFLKRQVKNRVVGMNFDRAPIWLFRNVKAKARKVENVSRLLMKRRRKKTKEEIKKIEEACKITIRALKKTIGSLEPEISELELAGKFVANVTEEGGYIAFDPIVAFGPSAAVPHHFPSSAVKYERGMNYLLDVSARFKMYASDVAISNPGRNSAARQAFNAVMEALDILDTLLLPGIKIAELVSSIEKIVGRMPHALGHGVGLEVHELPLLVRNSKEKLESGDVVAIEPAIYGSSFGIRLEQMYVVEENRVKKLCDIKKLLEKIV